MQTRILALAATLAATLAVVAFELLACVPARAPAASSPSPSGPTTAVTTTAPLERVAVVGASATAGFGARVDDGAGSRHSTDLGHALAAVLRDDDALVSTYGSIFFFRSPRRTGGTLLRRALRDEPTVLVAVDYLFWFGYGDRAADGTPIREEAQRLELLEKGLSLLDHVECPVVVGDFPDMSRAVGRMISRRQMPEPEMLGQLNARVHAWAAERPERAVVPLARTLERMRTGVELLRTDGTRLDVPGRPLLQRDELHPTGDGLVALARIIADILATSVEGAGAADLAPTHDAALERLHRALAPPVPSPPATPPAAPAPSPPAGALSPAA